MKLNQYSLLKEAYSIILKDSKEDILAGLEVLHINPNEPITKDNIFKLGFEEIPGSIIRGYYQTLDEPDIRLHFYPSYVAGKEGNWRVWAPDSQQRVVKTLGDLQKACDKFKKSLERRRQRLQQALQQLLENDKDNVMAGLEEIDKEESLFYKIININSLPEKTRFEELSQIVKNNLAYLLENAAGKRHDDGSFGARICDFSFNLYMAVSWLATYYQTLELLNVYHTLPYNSRFSPFECVQERASDAYNNAARYFRQFIALSGSQSIEESEKDNIMSGLDVLTDTLPPKEEVYHVRVKMDVWGFFHSWSKNMEFAFIPSTARKTIDGVYIDTAPNSRRPEYPLGTDINALYTLYITDKKYAKIFLNNTPAGIAQIDYMGAFTQEFLAHLYSSLGIQANNEQEEGLILPV